jgi:hypothetical protein
MPPDSRLRLMLGLLLLLGVIRFVFLPWLEWQGQRRDELAVVTNRMDKAQGVLGSKLELLAGSKELVALSARDFAPFPQYASTDVARLEIQRTVENLIRSNGGQIDLFVWLSEGRHEPSNLQFQRGRLVLRGSLRNLVKIQAELEAALRFLIFREVNVSFENAASGPNDAAGSLTVVMDAHYRLTGASSSGVALAKTVSEARGT